MAVVAVYYKKCFELGGLCILSNQCSPGTIMNLDNYQSVATLLINEAINNWRIVMPMMSPLNWLDGHC